ncbi:putative mucin TcMUCII [Trypanosoma cruzi]|uniref:Mucin TcMUCII, putative n=2 Tax=Trypanosoma cruzi TaxID=5693 RepID=Q4DDR9_TRYCC|nr:mucin TcMUCII, putative [Trypanosoma cruzi]EAN90668.1 mucin TcMUCII, putative [Trypanosoma cruzi]PWV14699.1 putative mucin TcMUCII [Trypanosoma cruzi]|eukprot:XP_812519.1 mucin TcMUCII [Trypanosoma cruzi strain CL Brener]
MTTCRLLCALLVLALCCCPSVCATTTGEGTDKGSSSSTTAQPQGTGGSGPKNTSTAPSSTPPTDALPSKSQDSKGQASDTRSDTARGTGGDQNEDSPSLSPALREGAGVPGSANPGVGTSEIPGNDAKQPDGTLSFQGAADAAKRNGPTSSTAASAPDSAGPAKTVEEPATISETGGKGPSSQASTGQTQGENSTSQGSGPGPGVPGSSGTEGPETIPKQEQATSGATGQSGLQIPIGVDQAKGETDPLNKPDTTTTNTTNAPATTTTTTTTAPEATSTTSTEAPSTMTTRTPSLLREIDGSLSSSAWVCAPLLLAVSALAYTTLG